MNVMQNYLEFKVPISRKAKWFDDLRKTFAKLGIQVHWHKKDDFHLTVAFMNDDTKVPDLQKAFAKHFKGRTAIPLTIDQLSAFRSSNRGDYIIHLSSSQPSEELVALIEALRNEVINCGVSISSSFIFHITLRRVDASVATLEEIENILATIEFPSFSVEICEAEYRFFRSKTIQSWKLRREK